MRPSLCFLSDLNEELSCGIFHYLEGKEFAALATSLRTCHQLGQAGLWHTFICQEFHSDCSKWEASAAMYWKLRSQELCQTLTWRQVPCCHRLASREGSPGVFCFRDHLFVFGGWSHGPANDLHAGPLTVPLTLHEVGIAGDPPPAAYDAQVTVLEDGPLEHTKDTVRVAITGGYRGGYHRENTYYGVIEIWFPEGGGAPRASWIRTGRMQPVANHSATFVPSSVAGPDFPQGYLLLFGGNRNGQVSDELEYLNLATFEWTSVAASRDRCGPRNSHSATLTKKNANEYGILILGGGAGDFENNPDVRSGGDDV